MVIKKLSVVMTINPFLLTLQVLIKLGSLANTFLSTLLDAGAQAEFQKPRHCLHEAVQGWTALGRHQHFVQKVST